MQITNEQIANIFSQNSKFIARISEEETHFEVIEMMNDDWRYVITDDQEVRSTCSTSEEAEAIQRQFHVRYVLNCEQYNLTE